MSGGAKVSITVGTLTVNGKDVGGVSGFSYEGPPEGLGPALDLHRGIESQVRVIDDEPRRNGRRLLDHVLLEEDLPLDVGDRVHILAGKGADRDGEIVKLGGPTFRDRVYVRLDPKPRERREKVEFVERKNLELLKKRAASAQRGGSDGH